MSLLVRLSSTHPLRIRVLTSDDRLDSWEQQRLDPQARLATFSWGIVGVTPVPQADDADPGFRTVQ